MGGHISCLVGCVVRLKAGGSYFLAHITATRLGADGEVELVVHSMAHAISASAISSMPPLAAEEQQWVLGQGGRPTVAQAAAALAAGTWPFTAAAAAERLACPALVAREEQWVSARRA